MDIGIVGGGVVGKATARAYLEHATVKVYDVVKERGTHPLDDTLTSDIVFVCLPTPRKEGSLECDLSYVDGFFHDRGGCLLRPYASANYVLRSTVPIGTTVRIQKQYGIPNLVHSPEFLTARTAFTDAQLPARNIVGSPRGVNQCVVALAKLYEKRFPGVQAVCCHSDTSEAVKLFLNGFFAVKVAYFNEIRNLCDKLDIPWAGVVSLMLGDGRIAHSHTQVPGPDGHRGFGGACLPKDLGFLMEDLGKHGCGNFVSLAAHLRNKLLDRGET
jgi:UDPglucose 6-dehydrogenase